jgi:hypothetical protein
MKNGKMFVNDSEVLAEIKLSHRVIFVIDSVSLPKRRAIIYRGVGRISASCFLGVLRWNFSDSFSMD